MYVKTALILSFFRYLRSDYSYSYFSSLGQTKLIFKANIDCVELLKYFLLFESACPSQFAHLPSYWLQADNYWY